MGSLVFRGVEAVPKSELADVALTSSRGFKFWAKRQRLDETSLREDLDRIVGFYRERGYYEASATYSLLPRESGDIVDIEIAVTEGDPVLIATRQIEIAEVAGLDADGVAEIDASLGLEVGDVFGIEAYTTAKEELRRRLGDLGYPASRIRGGVDVDLTSHSAAIRWDVEPGPQIRFGEIHIEGLHRVARVIVERDLQIRPGDVFSNEKLRATQRRIYGLDLFRSVEVLAKDPGDGSDAWHVTVRVVERDSRSVKLSVGYGTEDKFRAWASWIHRNFFGGARRLDVSAQYSSLLTGASVRFTQPRFPDERSTLEVDAAFLRETPPAYSSIGVGSGFRVSRPISEPWRAYGGYRVDYRDVQNVSLGDPREEGRTLLSYFELGLTRNTLDDRSHPTRGTWLELSLEPSFRGIGSDVDYVTLRAEGRWFKKLGPVVLGTRVRWGATQTFGSSNPADVPVFKLFYSGGSSSVRGFRYQHLGTPDAPGQAVGGLGLAEANIELRFPIWRWVSGVAFLDTGQVTREPFDLHADDFRFSAGPGLRIETPIGALRVDYGRLLNPVPGEDQDRIHLSIGHAF